MNTEVIDEGSIEVKKRINPISLVGIGAFFWIFLVSFSLLLEAIFRDYFILNNYHPITNYWVSKIISVTFVVFSFWLITKQILRRYNGEKLNVGLTLVILFLLFVISQFSLHYYTELMFKNSPKVYSENYMTYIDEMSSYKGLTTTQNLFESVKYGFLLIFCLANTKVVGE